MMDDTMREEALGAVRTLLSWIGEDVDREGLSDTPSRVLRAWEEMCAGYKQVPEEIVTTSFSHEGYSQMIVLGPIDFWSTCEHHLIPFSGDAFVGYVPGASRRILGISKLARAVDIYARRLQVQERMTEQIADLVEKQAGASGVGVMVRARHLCMTARGVRKHRSWMTTSALRGSFLQDHKTREEFMAIVSKGMSLT